MLLWIVLFAEFVFNYTDKRLTKQLDNLKEIFNGKFILDGVVVQIDIRIANLGISLSMNWAETVPKYLIGYYEGKLISITAPHYLALSKSKVRMEQMAITIEEKYVGTVLLSSILVHEIFHGMGFLSSLGIDYAASAGPVLMKSELVFMPPTLYDLVMYKNDQLLYDTYFAKLQGLCWYKLKNPLSSKPLEDIQGRVASYLHHPELNLDFLDTGPFMRDTYSLKMNGTEKNVYVMEGFIDHFLWGLKKGSSFDHIGSGIMHYKGNAYPILNETMDEFLKDDPAWTVFCQMGYNIRDMVCPNITLPLNFTSTEAKTSAEYCTQYLDTDLYETELRYWFSVRQVILLLVFIAIIVCLYFSCKFVYRQRKGFKRRKRPENLKVYV